MIRFRYEEDEKRYMTLLSEVYRIMGAKLPPREMTVVMRNLGKLQDILLLEGVRQGVSVASVGAMTVMKGDGHVENMKPLQLYGHIYGSHDTPLNEVERVWLKEMGVSVEDIPWLDMEPMQFAPDTEKAAAHEQAPPSSAHEKSRSAWDEWDAEDVKQELGEAGDDIHIDEMLARNEEGDTFESPQSLDRIRDVLLGMKKPDSWQELVLTVHRALHLDAGFVDMQLGTAMGRTVLAQAGFADLHPPPMGLDLSAVTTDDPPVVHLSSEELAERFKQNPGASQDATDD